MGQFKEWQSAIVGVAVGVPTFAICSFQTYMQASEIQRNGGPNYMAHIAPLVFWSALTALVGLAMLLNLRSAIQYRRKSVRILGSVNTVNARLVSLQKEHEKEIEKYEKEIEKLNEEHLRDEARIANLSRADAELHFKASRFQHEQELRLATEKKLSEAIAEKQNKWGAPFHDSVTGLRLESAVYGATGATRNVTEKVKALLPNVSGQFEVRHHELCDHDPAVNVFKFLTVTFSVTQGQGRILAIPELPKASSMSINEVAANRPPSPSSASEER